MNRLSVALVLIIILLAGCRKNTGNPSWEKTFGIGNALSIGTTPDSGLVSCGELEGKPYILKLDKNKNLVEENKYDRNGKLSSAWFNRNLAIAAGCSDGKLFITSIDYQNKLEWDTTFSTSFSIDHSLISYQGNGTLLAIGSAYSDTLNSAVTGLFCVWFTPDGTVTGKKDIKEAASISANSIVVDNSGNIYLALTRKSTGSQSKATVAKYNNLMQKLWETELYNNPSFGASAFGISIDNSGNLFVTGKTEVGDKSGAVDNSFAVSLSSAGSIRWKEYLEGTNSGSSLKFNSLGQILMLNQNCYIIDVLNASDGTSAGLIRSFGVCDSKGTDAIGTDLCLNWDGFIMIAGSNGGRFYIGMKSEL